MLYLSALVFLPIIGIFTILLLSKNYKNRYSRVISIAVFLLQLILALYITFLVNKFSSINSYPKSFVLTENYSWINFKIGEALNFQISYLLAADKINILLVTLSAFVFLIASILSKGIIKNRASYYCLIMLIGTAVVGCFLALDLILFFLFYELMLFPLFFLICIWGYGNKIIAAIKFFVFNFSASLFILLSIIIIGIFVYESTDIHSFNAIKLFSIIDQKHSLFTNFSDIHKQYNFNLLVFLLMSLGFCIKIPLFPFHLWLPKAHTSAPTPVSIILAGISLKVGYYGLLRFSYGFFPQLVFDFSIFIVFWSLFSIIYAAFNAFKSTDLKEMVAWSSISHMGFAIVGLASFTAIGLNGSILQILTHGLLTISLFLIPHIIFIRVNSHIISDYSGINKFMPKYVFISTLIFFISIGMPGFSVFISEMLIFVALVKFFLLNNINILFAIIFLTALFIGSLYWLKVIKNIFLGKTLLKEDSWASKLCDINFKESWVFIVIILIVFALGIYPNVIFNLTNTSVDSFIKYLHTAK